MAVQPVPPEGDGTLALVAVIATRPTARPRPQLGVVEDEPEVGPVDGAGADGAHLGRDVIAAVDAPVEQDVVDELHLGEQQAGPKGEEAKAKSRWGRAGHASTVRHDPRPTAAL